MALFWCGVGVAFIRFLNAVTAGATPLGRPLLVEAFLPISALLGLRNFVEAGHWDAIHPAGLCFLLVALMAGFLWRRSFCSVVCPIGLVSDGLAAAGKRLGLARPLRTKRARMWDRAWGIVGFGLLAFFFVVIFGRMSLPQVQAFLRSPDNLIADAKMAAFFANPSTTALIVFAVLALLGMLLPHLWCRRLCPYGALLGFLAAAGPVALHRDAAQCTGCRRCERQCPGLCRIADASGRIGGVDCIGCGQCAQACGAQDALGFRFFGAPLPTWGPVVWGTVTLVLGLAFTWEVGLWESPLPEAMRQALYARFLSQ